MTAVLLLTAVTCSGCTSPMPAVMPARFTVCGAASSLIAAGSAIPAIVGASFTGSTVTVKVREKVPLSPVVRRSRSSPASVSVTVITAVPHMFGIGV